MTSLVEAYLNARSEFERAKAEVRKIAVTISNVGQALASDPGQVSIANTNVGLPLGTVRPVASADEWKSAEQIMLALSKYHQARTAMRQTWQGVPPAQQSGLQPPLPG